MGKCSFLRQNKQVKINGEWVDTRSYRYLPYCDVIKQGITIKNGPPKGEVKIFFKDEKKYEDVFENGKSIYLDENGYGHIEIERNKLLDGICMGDNISYPSCEVEVKDCDVHYIRMTGMGKVNFSCSRLITDNQHHICDGLDVNEITFNSFDTSNARRMNMMFCAYPYITSLDLSSFDTRNVTKMSYMFNSCENITLLDVSNFNTSKVTNMRDMFYVCRGLKSLDVSNFNTSNVTDIGYMFGFCANLTSLDLSNFDTRKVTDMSCMFYNCSGLTSLDLSGWYMTNVTDTKEMFDGCSKLSTIRMIGCNVTTKNKIRTALSDAGILNHVTIIT